VMQRYPVCPAPLRFLLLRQCLEHCAASLPQSPQPPNNLLHLHKRPFVRRYRARYRARVLCCNGCWFHQAHGEAGVRHLRHPWLLARCSGLSGCLCCLNPKRSVL
jgi:hypothetical protein